MYGMRSNEMMLYFPQFFSRWPGHTNIKFFETLAAVSRNDGCIKMLCQLQGHSRFTHCRRPRNYNNCFCERFFQEMINMHSDIRPWTSDLRLLTSYLVLLTFFQASSSPSALPSSAKPMSSPSSSFSPKPSPTAVRSYFSSISANFSPSNPLVPYWLGAIPSVLAVDG